MYVLEKDGKIILKSPNWELVNKMRKHLEKKQKCKCKIMKEGIVNA